MVLRDTRLNLGRRTALIGIVLWVLLFVGGVVVLVGECVTLLSAEIQIF